jgi:hypothetical protein
MELNVTNRSRAYPNGLGKMVLEHQDNIENALSKKVRKINLFGFECTKCIYIVYNKKESNKIRFFFIIH